MTKRATARFPHADVLVEYMADFAKPQERDGHISYNTDVGFRQPFVLLSEINPLTV